MAAIGLPFAAKSRINLGNPSCLSSVAAPGIPPGNNKSSASKKSQFSKLISQRTDTSCAPTTISSGVTDTISTFSPARLNVSIAVNASIMLGYHIAGIPGAILAVLGTVLPPLIIISIISMFYQAFRNNVIVSMAMRGMLCGVAAVICDVVINMAKSIFQKKRPLPIIIMLASFIAVRYLSINIIIVIFVCGCIGTLDIWIKNMKRKAGNKQ